MKLELTTKQLELLEFVIAEFKCKDDTERDLIKGIVSQIYDVKEDELLTAVKILKAQSKQPTPQWS